MRTYIAMTADKLDVWKYDGHSDLPKCLTRTSW